MKNLGLKLLALTTALALYFFVHSQTNSSVISLVVPVELRNLPKDRVVLLPTIQQAQVTIKGPSFLLREVAISAPVFRIDLPSTIGERYEVVLTGDELTLPAAVEVTSIIPTRMELIFDQVISKEVVVEVPRLGALATDYQLASLTVEPQKVKVTGPETELRGLVSAQSQPINLTGLTEDREFKLSLASPGTNSRYSVDRVNVKVSVNVITQEKTFNDIAVTLRGPHSEELDLLSNLVDITVSGATGILQSLTTENINAYVAATPENIKAREVNVQVELPQGVELLEIKPSILKFVHRRIG